MHTSEINIQEHLAIDDIYNVAKLSSLITKEILANNKILLTSVGEGMAFSENGLYRILDEICQVTNYPKSNITLKTWNLIETHSEYKIEIVPEIYHIQWFSPILNYVPPETEHVGIFMGKANSCRLVAYSEIQKINWRDKLLYTFHHNFLDCPWPDGIRKYIKVKDTIDIKDFYDNVPHSDIGAILSTPIIPPVNIRGFENIYKDTCVEIVFETNPKSGFFITEKTLRPLYYGRPFIVIGAAGFADRLERLGFDLNFGFPKSLRSYDDIVQTQETFKFLSTWVNKTNLIEFCNNNKERIIHNQQVLNNLVNNDGKIDLSILNSI